jgi:hypothetical protein
MTAGRFRAVQSSVLSLLFPSETLLAHPVLKHFWKEKL